MAFDSNLPDYSKKVYKANHLGKEIVDSKDCFKVNLISR